MKDELIIRLRFTVYGSPFTVHGSKYEVRGTEGS
jgi:hypothetical protein